MLAEARRRRQGPRDRCPLRRRERRRGERLRTTRRAHGWGPFSGAAARRRPPRSNARPANRLHSITRRSVPFGAPLRSRHHAWEALMRIGPVGIWELLIILVLVLLVFGPRRLPEMAKGMGQAVREFRKRLREVRADIDADTEPARTEALSAAQQSPPRTAG